MLFLSSRYSFFRKYLLPGAFLLFQKAQRDFLLTCRKPAAGSFSAYDGIQKRDSAFFALSLFHYRLILKDLSQALIKQLIPSIFNA